MSAHSFVGRRILVTGASSGLGRSCAQRLAANGAQLVLVGRDAARLADVVPIGCADLRTCDLSDPVALSTLLAALKATCELIDGWVLAAGVSALRPVLMESPASLTQQWAINVQAPLSLLGGAIKARLVARGAAVVLFSSAVAAVGGSGFVSYSSTKGAIEAATRSLAAELATQQIRVNAIAPGVVRTPMANNYLRKLPSEQVDGLERRHLLGFGTPEDVSGCVAFLLSDDARWMTGSVLTVDGGFSVG